MSISKKITEKLKQDNKQFWASDNISDYLTDRDREKLIDEVEKKFEAVLEALIIDTQNDPNSKGTARRLAKMYINELMQGRYYSQPNVTAFPNNGNHQYTGMLVIRAELKSLCAHHHQTVSGVAYIGIIPNEKVIGLSKYVRIAQWCAKRGTLQEELSEMIAQRIMKVTECEDVGIHVRMTHGCMENRGVNAHSSLTQTTVLYGVFRTESNVKKEFFDNITLQEGYPKR